MANFWTGGTLRRQTFFNAVNPGSTAADIECFYLRTDGTIFEIESLTMQPGEQDQCRAPETQVAVGGWVILLSDRPVVVDGTFFSQDFRVGENGLIDPETRALARQHLATVPVDCSERRGVEFVCDFVAEQGFP